VLLHLRVSAACLSRKSCPKCEKSEKMPAVCLACSIHCERESNAMDTQYGYGTILILKPQS
jgi:hypothetical protein